MLPVISTLSGFEMLFGKLCLLRTETSMRLSGCEQSVRWLSGKNLIYIMASGDSWHLRPHLALSRLPFLPFACLPVFIFPFLSVSLLPQKDSLFLFNGAGFDIWKVKCFCTICELLPPLCHKCAVLMRMRLTMMYTIKPRLCCWGKQEVQNAILSQFCNQVSWWKVRMLLQSRTGSVLCPHTACLLPRAHGGIISH